MAKTRKLDRADRALWQWNTENKVIVPVCELHLYGSKCSSTHCFEVRQWQVMDVRAVRNPPVCHGDVSEKSVQAVEQKHKEKTPSYMPVTAWRSSVRPLLDQHIPYSHAGFPDTEILDSNTFYRESPLKGLIFVRGTGPQSRPVRFYRSM